MFPLPFQKERGSRELLERRQPFNERAEIPSRFDDSGAAGFASSVLCSKLVSPKSTLYEPHYQQQQLTQQLPAFA